MVRSRRELRDFDRINRICRIERAWTIPPLARLFPVNPVNPEHLAKLNKTVTRVTSGVQKTMKNLDSGPRTGNFRGRLRRNDVEGLLQGVLLLILSKSIQGCRITGSLRSKMLFEGNEAGKNFGEVEEMPEKTLNPQYVLDKSGQKAFVVLPVDEYESLLEDLQDLAAIAERCDEPR